MNFFEGVQKGGRQPFKTIPTILIAEFTEAFFLSLSCQLKKLI